MKIPENYIYTKDVSNKYSKSYNFVQIQRWIPLDEKINIILSKIENKNFSKTYPLKQRHIDNLKDFRDSIVHTKKNNLYEEYELLYRKSLSFKYKETLEAVKDFINFYEPDLVEFCTCNDNY